MFLTFQPVEMLKKSPEIAHGALLVCEVFLSSLRAEDRMQEKQSPADKKSDEKNSVI